MGKNTFYIISIIFTLFLFTITCSADDNILQFLPGILGNHIQNSKITNITIDNTDESTAYFNIYQGTLLTNIAANKTSDGLNIDKISSVKISNSDSYLKITTGSDENAHGQLNYEGVDYFFELTIPDTNFSSIKSTRNNGTILKNETNILGTLHVIQDNANSTSTFTGEVTLLNPNSITSKIPINVWIYNPITHNIQYYIKFPDISYPHGSDFTSKCQLLNAVIPYLKQLVNLNVCGKLPVGKVAYEICSRMLKSYVNLAINDDMCAENSSYNSIYTDELKTSKILLGTVTNKCTKKTINKTLEVNLANTTQIETLDFDFSDDPETACCTFPEEINITYPSYDSAATFTGCNLQNETESVSLLYTLGGSLMSIGAEAPQNGSSTFNLPTHYAASNNIDKIYLNKIISNNNQQKTVFNFKDGTFIRITNKCDSYDVTQTKFDMCRYFILNTYPDLTEGISIDGVYTYETCNNNADYTYCQCTKTTSKDPWPNTVDIHPGNNTVVIWTPVLYSLCGTPSTDADLTFKFTLKPNGEQCKFNATGRIGN